MSVAEIGIIALLYVAAGETPDATQRTATVERLIPDWRDLESPYYAERRRAVRHILLVEGDEGAQLVEALLLDPRAEFRSAGYDWLILHLERGLVNHRLTEVLVQAALAETDPSARERIAHVVARDGGAVARIIQAANEDRIDHVFLGRVLEARIVRLLESIMHEGHVPGFFDGQFAELHALHPSAYARLLRHAWDPRVGFVVRSLAVMALHEAGSDQLATQLGALIISAELETEVPLQFSRAFFRMRFDERDFRLYLVCRLSQYARFSLAKAGVSGPIDEKITYLQTKAARQLLDAEEAPDTSDDVRLSQLDEAMDTYFELGYHFQQLDRYVQAELHYRVITERPESLRAQRWAYYNLACIRAIQGRKEEALTELRQAMDAGFNDTGWAMRDGDLQSLRDDPRFYEILHPHQ